MKSCRATHIKIARDIDEKVEWYTDATLLEIIVRDMLENATGLQKRDRQNNVIRIGFRKDRSHVVLSFASGDVNNGTPESEDIFKMFAMATEHQSLSLGLYIVQVCVERLKGSIDLVHDSTVTEFRIRLPLHLKKPKDKYTQRAYRFVANGRKDKAHPSVSFTSQEQMGHAGL